MKEKNLETLTLSNVEDATLDLTPVQNFFSGTNVLITGATGLLGKLLLEKLLRSCPSISTIYLLIRNKKEKNLHTRIDEIFDDVVFERLKNESPKFRHKVIGIGGDCCLPEVGLSLGDRELLIQEISVVFHVAATVRFDEKLKTAVAINVRAPRDLLLMAQQMKQLKTFMHVSTAFANCPNRVIEERLENPPISSKTLILLTENVTDKILDKITSSILDKWPNTYAYTKAVAEDAVKQAGANLPVGIFRPAIVVSTYKEPVVAWINNMYGPTGVCAGSGNGVLRTMQCDASVNANMVPADMCINALIASAWVVGTNYKHQQEIKSQEVPVFNYESSNDQPITWGAFMHYNEYYGMKVPSIKALWYYCLILHKNKLAYLITAFFLHFVPAIIMDACLVCVGKRPTFLKSYRKIHKFSNVISYFCTRSFIFKSSRVRDMINNMDDKDKDIFFCDLKHLNWEEFFVNYIRGIRMYLLHDPIETLEEAKIKWNRLYWLHQGIKLLLGFLIMRFLWYIALVIFSNLV